jgi:L-lactate dehydrogenase complex protein LldG
MVGPAVSDARAEILDRVRAASVTPAGEIARGYRRSGELTHDERTELFRDRVDDYRADVLITNDVEYAVTRLCAERGWRRLALPPGLPWRPGGVELVEDHDLPARELDAVDGALTGCTTAIAETGTIVLTAGPHEGRRALTLVPDVHICVVRESQICELLPEALGRIDPHRPITFISGPSATSDIELSRVEGVHGPRTLVVIVAKEAA